MMVDNKLFDALSSYEEAVLLTILHQPQQQNETHKRKTEQENRELADILKDILSGPLEKKILSEEEKKKEAKGKKEESKETYGNVITLIKGLRETSSYVRLSRTSAPSYSAPSTTDSPYAFAHSFYESEYTAYSPSISHSATDNSEPESHSAVISSEEYSHYIMRFTIAQAIGASTLGIVNYELKRKADYFTMFMHNSPFVTLKLFMTGLGVGYEMAPETMVTNTQAA